MTQHNRRGRPRLDPAAPASSVSLGITARDYDAIRKVAALRRESIQDVIRRSIRRDPELAARRATPESY